MDHFSDADIEEIFSYEKPRLESTGSQSSTQKDVDYATFLKRKFAPNPQEPKIRLRTIPTRILPIPHQSRNLMLLSED
jgi:hypothetical protein